MALDNVTFVKALASAASQEFKDRIGEVTSANAFTKVTLSSAI